jgi:hypothetical protein
MTRRENGSALVEAMVGAAIIAITLASMYAAILESAARNRMAEQRRIAMLIAQSALDTVGPLIPATPGVSEGAAGDYYWRVDIEPYGTSTSTTSLSTPSLVGQLAQVDVLVADSHRRPLANLSSLILTSGT